MAVSYPLVVNGLDLTNMMGEGMTINGPSPVQFCMGDMMPTGLSATSCYLLCVLFCRRCIPPGRFKNLTPVDAMRSLRIYERNVRRVHV